MLCRTRQTPRTDAFMCLHSVQAVLKFLACWVRKETDCWFVYSDGGNFPPELRTVFTSLSPRLFPRWSLTLNVAEVVSQSLVCPLKLWSHTSPSVGTTCPVVCPVWFQLWSNLILAERKWPWFSMCLCSLSVKLHMVYILYIYKVVHMGNRLDVLLPVYKRDPFLLLWGSLQLKQTIL